MLSNSFFLKVVKSQKCVAIWKMKAYENIISEENQYFTFSKNTVLKKKCPSHLQNVSESSQTQKYLSTPNHIISFFCFS